MFIIGHVYFSSPQGGPFTVLTFTGGRMEVRYHKTGTVCLMSLDTPAVPVSAEYVEAFEQGLSGKI